MNNRSVVAYDPSCSPSSSYRDYFVMSSEPSVVDGNMYVCMARVRLALAFTIQRTILVASTTEVRIARIPWNHRAPWSDQSSNAYDNVADAFLNVWDFAEITNIPLRTSLSDVGLSIGVRRLLAASFHSNSSFQVPVTVLPGPVQEENQQVSLSCSAVQSVESQSAVMFAYASSINRTHFVCNVVLFQHRYGQGSLILTAQDNGGNLYGGSNQSLAVLSVVVTPSNSPPRFSFRSASPFSYDGLEGSATINMSTNSAHLKLGDIVGLTAGRNEDDEQFVNLTVVAVSGNRLLQSSPYFRSGGIRSLMLSLVPFLFGNLTLKISATDNGPGMLSASRILHVKILNVNNPPFCLLLSPLSFRRSTQITYGVANFSVCPGPGDEIYSQSVFANFSGDLVTAFTPLSTVSSNGCPIYEVMLTIPAGFFGNSSQIRCSAIDNHNSSSDSTHSVSVLYVNSKPSFRIVTTNFSFPQNSSTHTIGVVLTDVSRGAYDDDQMLQCRLSGVNMSFFDEVTFNSTAIEFEYAVSLKTKSVYTLGRTSFDVVCTDNGGTMNNGDDSFSSPIFFDFTLVNFPPYFNINSRSITLMENSLLQSFSRFIYNVSAGQPAENSDLLTFSIETDNNMLFHQINVSYDSGANFATLYIQPAAHLFGSANVTVNLTEISQPNPLVSLVSFQVYVLPIRPFPDFNISNSSIELREDFGDVTIFNFISSVHKGGGESNAEEPVFYEFNVTNVLDVSKPHSQGSSWSQVYMDINRDGDLRIVSQPNQWGTLVAYVVFTNSFASKGLNYSSPTRSFRVMIAHVNDPPEFNFSSSEIIIPDNVSFYVAERALINITVGPLDEVQAGVQRIKDIVCSFSSSSLSISRAIVPDCVGFSVCTSASIHFSLLPYTSGSTNLSCCVSDTGGSSSCQNSIVKVLSDFHLLPQGDIFVGSPSENDYANVIISSHVRIILPQVSSASDGLVNYNDVSFSFSVSNSALFHSQPQCVLNVSFCNIVFIPTPQNHGESVVRITANHNSRHTSASFKIRVGRVNQIPSFAIPTDVISVRSGFDLPDHPNFVLNVTAGPFDADQSTFFVIEASNSSQASLAFSELPRISNNGTLSFALKPHVYGRFGFSCTLVEAPSGLFAPLNFTLYFSIDVAFVNRPPSFSYKNNTDVSFTTNELFIYQNFLENVRAGPVTEDWQNVFCQLTPLADYSRAFVVSPFVAISGSQGTLYLQLTAGRYGTFNFSLFCKDDGGIANQGLDSALPVVVSFVAPNVNLPPSLDPVIRGISFNSSASVSVVSAKIVSTPAPASTCVPHVASVVQVSLNSSAFIDASSYFIKPQAAYLPVDRLNTMRAVVSYKPPQSSSANLGYNYVAESYGAISVWNVINTSEASLTATQIYQYADGSVTGFLSESVLEQNASGVCGVSSWVTNGDVYSFISGGCDDLNTRPTLPPGITLNLFTAWNFDPKRTTIDGSGTLFLRPSGGIVASNGVLRSSPAYYGSIPLMFCTGNEGGSCALQVAPDISSLNFPTFFSLELTFSSYSFGSEQRVIVSAASPISSLHRGFYLAITSLNFVEFGIVSEHYADDSGEYGRYSKLISNQPVTFGQLTHVVASYDGNSMYLYINGLSVGLQSACMFPPCGSLLFALPGEPAIPLIVGGSSMVGWFHSFSIHSAAIQAADVLRLYQLKTGPHAPVASIAVGMVLHSDGQLGSVVLNQQVQIQLFVSGYRFSQIRYSIVCPRGSLYGSCSVGPVNSSGISSVSCPQPISWAFGTSVDCAFNLIGQSTILASQVPLLVSLITPSYVRKYNQDLSGFVDSPALIGASGCAASAVANYGSRRFIFTARTWAGSNFESVVSPVFEILGASVVEVDSMRVSIPRAVDVAAVEFKGKLFVAFASEMPISTVFVYLSGSLSTPISISVGQSAYCTALFSSTDFVYAVFCSTSSVSSTCNVYNIQENSAYLIQTLTLPRIISDSEVFSVSSGQIFLSLSSKIYLWNSLSRSFVYHSDVGSDVTNAKFVLVGGSDVLVTYAPNSSSGATSAPAISVQDPQFLGQLRFRLFDPVTTDFIEMPSQPGQTLATGTPSSRLFSVWTSGSKLFAFVGGFATSMTLKSFSISQIATGLSDFIDMRVCKSELDFASLFVLSADLKNTLSWYQMNDNGTLTIVASLQSNGVSMIRCRALSVQCDSQIAVLACSDGVFVVSFSRGSRSLVSGMPLLAQNSSLYSAYLSSITSLSFVSRIGSLPIVVAASYSKGFICTIDLVSENSYLRLSDVIDVKLDGLTTFFQWVSQPSIANDAPLLNGTLPSSKSSLHTDSYSFSLDDTHYLVTFSPCDSLVTSQALLYAMNNVTKSWVSLGNLPGSDGACSARFCDGGIGKRYLAVAVNHLNGLQYVQSSLVYRQSSVVTVGTSSSNGAVFNFFSWETIFSTLTKGAVGVLSVKASECIFVFPQEGDGNAPEPNPCLLLLDVRGNWSVADSNLYVSRSGSLTISNSAPSAPTSDAPVKTSFSSLSSNSRFFSALNSVVGLMIFGFLDSQSQSMSPSLVAQELWLVNCFSVALFNPHASSSVIVSVSCRELSHVFVLKQNASSSSGLGLTRIGSYPASFSSTLTQRCSPDKSSCTLYLAFLSSDGVGLRIVKDSQVTFFNPLPSMGVYGSESSLAASSHLVNQTSNVFQSAPNPSWKISSVLRSDGDFFAVFDDSLRSEFFVSDALNPRLSLRGTTALSNSFLSHDNFTCFGALSISPPRVSLFQLSPSGKFQLKSFIPASLSRFLSAKELDVSVDVGTSLLKIAVGTGACDIEQDQSIKLLVSASESLTKLLSTPPSINMLGVLSATLKGYSAGSGSVNVTATDSFGASSSVSVDVVVNSVSNPVVTVLSPIVTLFVRGLGKQTVTSVLSSTQSIGTAVSFAVLNVTNPSMFSIQPLFTSMGHLVCGTTASESQSEVTVVSRSFRANGIFQSEPVNVRVIFRLVNRPPVPIILKQVAVPMNSGPLNILNVVSCNMSADGKDVGQVLLRYNYQSIEELTGSIRQQASHRISAMPSLSVNGTLSISFATGVVGSFLIYFTATDSGGIASGGVDTSPPFFIEVFVQSSLAAVPVITLPNNVMSINVQQNSGFNSVRLLVSPGLIKRSFARIVQVNATVVSSTLEGIIFNVVAGVEGSLNFTVKSGPFGSAVVKVAATDSDNLSSSANFVVNVLSTDNIRPSIAVIPYVALTQNPTASYVVPNFVLSASVGNDLFEQSNQVIVSIDVAVDAAATAPGYFLTTPTVSFQGRFLMLNTRPGVFGRFVLKVTAMDSGYVGNVSPESTVEGFIFAAPVIIKVVPDMLSPAGGDMVTVNGMHFGS
jgi:hypothetical protein